MLLGFPFYGLIIFTVTIHLSVKLTIICHVWWPQEIYGNDAAFLQSKEKSVVSSFVLFSFQFSSLFHLYHQQNSLYWDSAWNNMQHVTFQQLRMPHAMNSWLLNCNYIKILVLKTLHMFSSKHERNSKKKRRYRYEKRY